MGENGMKEELERAMEAADPYRGNGTVYLHGAPAVEGGSDEAAAAIRNNIHHNPTGAVVVPISLATTFKQTTPGEATAPDDPNSFGVGYEYSRTGNPTRGAFERAIAAAEKARYGVAFASGSAATSAVLHCLGSPTAAAIVGGTDHNRNHVLCVDDVYGGTQRYFRRIAQPLMNLDFDFVDFNDPEKPIPFTENTKLVWLETPSNPTLKITDIARVAAEAHKQPNNSCLLAVDNTFCSPYNQTPLELGADLVVHSVTKYIGGHSDVVMGVVCTNREDLYRQLRFVQNGVGAVPSPFDCFLAHRGLKTLHLRMEASARNAYALALFLEGHPMVDRVAYPGLPSHPQHELAKSQQHGFGSMITFYCKGGRAQSAAILQNLHVFALAESLGAVESLAESPSLMTHASVPDAERVKLGIDDTLIRLSVGVEGCKDLMDDLRSALDAALKTL